VTLPAALPSTLLTRPLEVVTATLGNYAAGHATCRTGHLRWHSADRGGAGVISHIWTVESGLVPKKRGWYVSMNSDLGGAPDAISRWR
jgi:hypothetical protein